MSAHPRSILLVDPALCTGCSACQVFCSLEKEGQVYVLRSRIEVRRDEPSNLFIPVVCPPCQAKSCMAACPEPGAMTVDEETGSVLIVEENCTGCSKCIRACEIGAIGFLREAGRGKRGKAVVVKCDQCGGNPWCVRVCAPGALRYGAEEPGRDGQAIYEDLRVQLARSRRWKSRAYERRRSTGT